MMMDAVPVWQKLWWKGVDISATVIGNAISAVIVVILAEITWKRKRDKDLEFERAKDKQRRATEQQLRDEEAAHGDKLRRIKLARELDAKRKAFVDKILKSFDDQALLHNYNEASSWITASSISWDAVQKFYELWVPDGLKDYDEIVAHQDKQFVLSNAKQIADVLAAIPISEETVK